MMVSETVNLWLAGPMTFLRKLAISVVVAVGLAVLCLAVLWPLVRYQRRRFESMATCAAKFHAGKSTAADAEDFLRTFQRGALVEHRDCAPTECIYEVLVSNFMLSVKKDGAGPDYDSWSNIQFLRMLGIRPGVAITRFTIRGGVVQEVFFGTAYQDNAGQWIWASWEAQDELSDYASCWALAAGHPTYIVSHTHTGSGPFSGLSVSSIFSEHATQSDRTRCLRIRFECMTRPRECGRLAFMPQVQEDIEAEDVLRKDITKQYEASVSDCHRKKGLLP